MCLDRYWVFLLHRSFSVNLNDGPLYKILMQVCLISSNCCHNVHGKNTSLTQGSPIIIILKQKNHDGLNLKSWKNWKVKRVIVSIKAADCLNAISLNIYHGICVLLQTITVWNSLCRLSRLGHWFHPKPIWPSKEVVTILENDPKR